MGLSSAISASARRAQFRIVFRVENGPGFLQAFQCLAVLARLFHDGLQVDAFLVDLGGALVVVAHLEHFLSQLFVSFFNAFNFVEHKNP